MWYSTALLLVSCALVVGAEEGAGELLQPASTLAPSQPATTRAPPRTLDRQSNYLVWRSYLQSPESGSQNAPPRRITTKSLFIPPLICPKGQRLDRNACVQVVTVHKDEHDSLLLEQLNALQFTPSSDVVYDYGDDEPSGPLQITFNIPIGPDPQAAPLQADPSAQAQELQPNYVKFDKKQNDKPESQGSIEAELELLKLQNSMNRKNDTVASDNAGVLNHDVMNNLMPMDKPKRDSVAVNSSEIESANNSTDQGQKEIVYGHVNVDPILYGTDPQTTTTEFEETTTIIPLFLNDSPKYPIINDEINNAEVSNTKNVTITNSTTSNSTHELKKDGDKTKLNPENEYADIGEAIKLISRYAEVTTDDNFSKDQKKNDLNDDSILGTRTKLQHRRNRPKTNSNQARSPTSIEYPADKSLAQVESYYRYPWQGQHSPTPPPNYPFRHLQDYWPGRTHVGGLYNTAHENPRRHHHKNYQHFKLHAYAEYPRQYARLQEPYPGLVYGRRTSDHSSLQARSNQQDSQLYSLLGLRHLFNNEDISKR